MCLRVCARHFPHTPYAHSRALARSRANERKRRVKNHWRALAQISAAAAEVA
jgi:hypothetical protein